MGKLIRPTALSLIISCEEIVQAQTILLDTLLVLHSLYQTCNVRDSFLVLVTDIEASDDIMHNFENLLNVMFLFSYHHISAVRFFYFLLVHTGQSISYCQRSCKQTETISLFWDLKSHSDYAFPPRKTTHSFKGTFENKNENHSLFACSDTQIFIFGSTVLLIVFLTPFKEFLKYYADDKTFICGKSRYVICKELKKRFRTPHMLYIFTSKPCVGLCENTLSLSICSGLVFCHIIYS